MITKGKYAYTRDLIELEKRVQELEEKLGSVKIPSVEHVLSLQDVYGGEDAALLLAGKMNTVAAVKVASDDELLAIKGIGPAAVKRIRKVG
jgi:ERCC4-type nuclease